MLLLELLLVFLELRSFKGEEILKVILCNEMRCFICGCEQEKFALEKIIASRHTSL
jgi:hypothetical protein